MYIHEVNDSIDNHHTTYSIVYSYVPSFMGDSKMGGFYCLVIFWQ